jgi:hypothetical protein
MPIIDPICLIDDGKPTIFLGKGATGIGSVAQPPEIIMSIRNTILATTFTLASLLGAAHADGVRPIQARSIDLGKVSGVAYYTVERDGFRVVTTLAQGEAGTPVRVVAVLGPGQSVMLSTPRESGVAPVAVEISRQADTVLVRKAAAATN